MQDARAVPSVLEKSMLLRDVKSVVWLQAKLIRRAARRIAQQARYRRLSLHGVPVLFANSFPKSGTHLLTQALQGFTALGPAVDSGLPAVVTFDGITGEQRPAEAILRDLRRFRPGDIAYGHVHALPEVVVFLCQSGCASFFILRDPRDVVISHVHYITEMEPNHVHHRFYKETLKTFEERLRISILGRPDIAIPFPNVAERFAPYLGWLDHPEVLILRYEDFIAEPDTVLGWVFDHVVQRGFPSRLSRAEAIGTLKRFIDPKRSPTFRAGKINAWRENFTPEIKALFKSIAGDLLIKLGYEKDNDW